MKKFLSLVLAAVMLMAMTACAFAESDMSDWVEVEMTDIGMHFYRPADMITDDPDTEADQVYVAANEDVTVAIYVIGTGDSTADDLIVAFQEQGLTAEINALSESGLTYDHIFVASDEDANYAAVIFLGSDNCWYDFEAYAQNENGLTTYGMILGTLSPIE